MIALPIILSSNGLASEIIFGQGIFVTAIDTTGKPGDSIRIVYDSAGIPIDTIRNDTTPQKPLFDDLIKYTADDSVKFSIREKKVYLYGNGYVKYLTTELKADYIELDMDKKLAFACGVPDSVGELKGNPNLKDKGQEFDSKELRYNFDTKKAYITNIVTQEGEGYLQSELTKKLSDSVYCVKHGTYTTCDEHDHPHFGLRMNKAKMIKDKKIFTTFTYLELEGIPLPIALPFAFFPITKKGTSGIIMPTYGEERMRGFNLRGGGYYFYINDFNTPANTGNGTNSTVT